MKHSSHDPNNARNNTAINNAEYNLGAAMAVVLGLVIFGISVASLVFRRRRGEW